MPIISKETWDNLIPEDEKNKVRRDYQVSIETGNGKVIYELENLFGKEQLQSKQLTYEDVARELFGEDRGNAVFYINQFGEILESSCGLVDSITDNPTNCTSQKQAEKLLAINKLLNVAKFLNKDWRPDWNYVQDKWYLAVEKGKVKVDYHDDGHNSHIVYFRTEELAKQAIQILGEDTVRLALSCEW